MAVAAVGSITCGTTRRSPATWTARSRRGAARTGGLAAIRSARAEGVRVLLATGRILAELVADMPGLAGEFDAVVAENGAVLAVGDREPVCLSEPARPPVARRRLGRHRADRSLGAGAVLPDTLTVPLALLGCGALRVAGAVYTAYRRRLGPPSSPRTGSTRATAISTVAGVAVAVTVAVLALGW